MEVVNLFFTRTQIVLCLDLLQLSHHLPNVSNKRLFWLNQISLLLKKCYMSECETIRQSTLLNYITISMLRPKVVIKEPLCHLLNMCCNLLSPDPVAVPFKVPDLIPQTRSLTRCSTSSRPILWWMKPSHHSDKDPGLSEPWSGETELR